MVFEGGFDEQLKTRIRTACHAHECFVAAQVELPLLFSYLQPERSIDDRYDHGWHEFSGLRPTRSRVTDERRRTISEFVAQFVAAAEKGWEVRGPSEIVVRSGANSELR